MSFLSGIRSAFDPDRLAMSQALLNGDYAAVAQLGVRRQELARQNAELQLRQQAAQRAEQDRNYQVWGAKELGFTNPEIAAMNGQDLSQAERENFDPYTLSAGQQRHQRGPGGVDQVTTAPTDDQQNYAAWNAISPDLGRAYAHRQVYGAPTPIPEGGGLAGYDDAGNPTWVVPPASIAGAPTTSGQGGAPSSGAPGGGAAALHNPLGIRYPGTTRYRSFPSDDAGMAYGQRLLGGRSYVGGGNNTVRGVVERWAPRRSRGGDNSDQQVDGYISRVAGELGVSPDQPLAPADIQRLSVAMSHVETGRGGSAPRSSVANAPRVGGQASANADQLRAQAQAAIRAGRNPDMVRARLRQMGVSDAGL